MWFANPYFGDVIEVWMIPKWTDWSGISVATDTFVPSCQLMAVWYVFSMSKFTCSCVTISITPREIELKPRHTVLRWLLRYYSPAALLVVIIVDYVHGELMVNVDGLTNVRLLLRTDTVCMWSVERFFCTVRTIPYMVSFTRKGTDTRQPWPVRFDFLLKGLLPG